MASFQKGNNFQKIKETKNREFFKIKKQSFQKFLTPSPSLMPQKVFLVILFGEKNKQREVVNSTETKLQTLV